MKNTESGKIILIGGSGHAESLIDAAGGTDNIFGIVERDRASVGSTVCGVRVVCCDEDVGKLRLEGVGKFIIALGHIGNYNLRKDLFERMLSDGFEPVNIIHPTAWVSQYAKIGAGNAVLAGAVINAGAVLGDNNIINSNSVVEHDTVCGDNIHIAPGSVICGGSKIGSDSLIGAGSVVIQGTTIGERVLVGAGSTVLNDIPDDAEAFGSPAKIISIRT